MNSTENQRSADMGMRESSSAALNALTGGPDYSNGAVGWDGTDLPTNPHRYGTRYTDPAHDIFHLGNTPLPNGSYDRESTVAH